MNQNFSVFRELGVPFRNICNQFFTVETSRYPISRNGTV